MTLRQHLLLQGPIPQHWWQSGVCMLNGSSEEHPPPGAEAFIMQGQRLGQRMMRRLFSVMEVRCPSDKTMIVWWMYTHSSACNIDIFLIHSD